MKLRWGIIGAGRIAGALAGAVKHGQTGELRAIGSRAQASADEFARKFDIPKAYSSYEALLADPDVDIVYVATPHTLHPQWAIRALEAGKHVLSEKPMSLNQWHSMAVIETARRSGKFLMEAFMYRCHPQTKKLLDLIREGVIGEVRMIRASFGFDASKAAADSRLMCNALGGGGILDVGCYPVSMSRLLVGAVEGKPFSEPTKVQGAGKVGPTVIDDWAAATLQFECGITAQVATAVKASLENDVVVYGSEGRITVPNPWVVCREGGESVIHVQRKGQQENVVVKTDQWLYEIEADVCAAAIAAGKQQADSPAMSWDDSLGNARALDQWRAAIGLVYEGETSKGYTVPVHGRPLAKPAQSQIATCRLPGLNKDISRLVMGCDNQQNFSHAALMFDAFYEVGGTTFDTAHIYGGGAQERLLGEWIKSRGVRDQVVTIVKGAHTPFCNPADLRKQLAISLERMQLDGSDLYIMHRDNPDIPVSEFVDVLNELADAGKFKLFGGSNWSQARVEAFNADARQRGKRPMSVVSNNFSLARMVDPVWAGCIASSTPEYKAWHEKTQTALFSWSSQARGFFVPERQPDAEMTRCWVSDDNHRRRERAFELAKRKNVLPINIALAYVLCQPFPVCALFGPRVLSELYSSLPGANLKLTPAELAWLNLETQSL